MGGQISNRFSSPEGRLARHITSPIRVRTTWPLDHFCSFDDLEWIELFQRPGDPLIDLGSFDVAGIGRYISRVDRTV